MDQQEEERYFKLVRRRNVVGAILIFIGVFAVQIVVYAAMSLGIQLFFILRNRPTGLITEYTRQIVEWYSVAWAVVCAVWCGILYHRSDWRYPLDYRVVFTKKHILQIFLTGFCGCFVTLYLLGILNTVFPEWFISYGKTMEHLSSGSIVMLFYTLLAGPVAEELIFRGAIFDRLYLAFPFSAANLIQALLFAVYHGNLIQGIYAFLFGLLLGRIHYVSKSIYSNIACHILFNLTNYFAGSILAWINRTEFQTLFFLFLFLSLAGVCWGVVSLYREEGNENADIE